jgi:hypothetical protein
MMKKPWEMTEEEWNSAMEGIRANASGTGGDGKYSRAIGKAGAGKAFSGFLNEYTYLTMGLPDIIPFPEIPDFRLAPRYRNVIEEAKRRGYIPNSEED